MTTDAIRQRLRSNRLIRVHQGVFAVGHAALSDRGRCVAALLATGPGASLSHRTALALHRLIPSMPELIEVTLTTRRPRRRAGIKIHHAAHVETTIEDGLPVTTVAQTLKDVPDRRATAEALYRGLIDRTQAEAEPTQSELEDPLLPALATTSSSRPTAGRSTATASRSRTTAPATRTCRRTDTASSDSPGSR